LFLSSTGPFFQGFAVSEIDQDVWQALAICKGDAMAALRMVLFANAFYEAEIERLKRQASSGFARGKNRKPKKAS
jgi:hypothetical protein